MENKFQNISNYKNVKKVQINLIVLLFWLIVIGTISISIVSQLTHQIQQGIHWCPVTVGISPCGLDLEIDFTVCSIAIVLLFGHILNKLISNNKHIITVSIPFTKEKVSDEKMKKITEVTRRIADKDYLNSYELDSLIEQLQKLHQNEDNI